MKMKVLSVLCGAGACVALLSNSAIAATHTRGIDRTEHREQMRIREGIRSGELTRAEARRLETEQARIRVDERFDKADGKVTPKEREKLHKELRRAGRDIYRQKHDNQNRD